MRRLALFIPILLLLIAACGGGSGGVFPVGGEVSGLEGTLVLKNGAETLTITQDGPFTFSSKIPSGGEYDVSVVQAPPLQNCRVENGRGKVAGEAVNDIRVLCQDKTWQTLELGRAVDTHTLLSLAAAGEHALLAWGYDKSSSQAGGWQAVWGADGWEAPVQFSSAKLYALQSAAGANGTMVLLWIPGNNAHRVLLSKAFFPDGATLTQALSDLGNDAYEPSIAVAASGEALAVWIEKDGSGDRHVYSSSLVRSSGAWRWTTPTRLNDPNHKNCRSPVAATNGLTSLVAWIYNQAVRVSVYASGAWRPEYLLATNASHPTAIVTGSGRVYLAWTESLGFESHVLLRTYAGGSWGVRQEVAYKNASAPRLTLTANDTPQLFWNFTEAGKLQWYAQTCRDGAWSRPEPLSLLVSNVDWRGLSVSGGPEDSAAALWLQPDSGGQYLPYLATLTPLGWKTPASDADTAFGETAKTLAAQIAFLSNGDLLGAWIVDKGTSIYRLQTAIRR